MPAKAAGERAPVISVVAHHGDARVVAQADQGLSGEHLSRRPLILLVRNSTDPDGEIQLNPTVRP